MTQTDVLRLFEEAFEMDPVAMDGLLCLRIPCNEKISNHPTIVVSCKNDKGDFPVVGILGIVNGFLAKEGTVLAARYDDDTHCLVGFELRKSEVHP